MTQKRADALIVSLVIFLSMVLIWSGNRIGRRLDAALLNLKKSSAVVVTNYVTATNWVTEVDLVITQEVSMSQMGITFTNGKEAPWNISASNIGLTLGLVRYANVPSVTNLTISASQP